MRMLHHWLTRCRSLWHHLIDWLPRCRNLWHLLSDWLRLSSTAQELSQCLRVFLELLDLVFDLRFYLEYALSSPPQVLSVWLRFFLELLDLVFHLLLHFDELLQAVLDVLLLD